MTDNSEGKKAVGNAVKELANMMVQANVPDPGDKYPGFEGLPSDHRRILYALDRMAAYHRRKRKEDRAVARETPVYGANGDPMHQPSKDPPPESPPPSLPPDPTPMDEATKFEPSVNFIDSPARLSMTAETPSLPPEEDAVATGETSRDDADEASGLPQLGFDAPKPAAEPGHATGTGPTVVSEPATRGRSAAPPEAAMGARPVTGPKPSARREATPALSAPQPGGIPAAPVRPAATETKGIMPIETVKKMVYLKNAKANEPYQGAVEMEGLKDLKLQDDGGSGLALDEASGLLKGIPTNCGDFVVRLQGLLFGRRCEIVANLAVIPDPKSLWVTKDSDRSDPYWKPDEAFDRKEGDLLCVAASKRGRSHAKDGTFRDDDFGLWESGPEGWHIAVVADGAGSAKYSRRGSKIAVDRVLGELPKLLQDHLTEHLEKLIPAHLQGNEDASLGIKGQLYLSLATVAFNAAKAIEEEAAVKAEKASAFSTTLIIGVVRKVPEGWFIAGFSVGDGGAAVFNVQDGSLTPLTQPDSGEFAGQTRFLQKSEFSGGFEDVVKRIFFDVREEFTAVTLMTDGISDPKFPTDVAFADPARWMDFWNDDLTEAVNFSRENEDMERQILEWLDFWSPGNHDDRTIAVLVP
ncbi:protein phosphatase 2C domain-containing protein [Rhodospirillum sp. A1_3_36]|uniref:protein phosphatase 2C domain-containing protein n=1 Tax=Rhodospirillum sp. A1_3_36 TaxID=3391666 RepID=UPI0039A6ABC4